MSESEFAGLVLLLRYFVSVNSKILKRSNEVKSLFRQLINAPHPNYPPLQLQPPKAPLVLPL
jgi:hypothetical protein